MGAVVFCNIAWMKNYRGITDEDQPYNGGSFVKENNDAMEQKNFLPINGKCYGFVMHRGQLHIERLDRTAIKTDVLSSNCEAGSTTRPPRISMCFMLIPDLPPVHS